MHRNSRPWFRTVQRWLLLAAGWIGVTALAGWWAHGHDIEWALRDSGRGPNYLLVVGCVYWGAVFCVAMVAAAREGVGD
ncbi:hypothetical protein [Aeromicrobium sp. UC242_57]|uniref:hypothetical protein n=1 Tax=Aeromicrobium sp. UC242_57 TaxID=3374624 RepID=UPI00378DE6B6